MSSEVLTRQLKFLKEIDRLKGVLRQSPLLDRSRKENSAEHSWHLAMYAWLLQEYAAEQVNASRVIQMLLLHDVVEVDAGDTPIHSGCSHKEQTERETSAAIRLFGLLPDRQGAELMALWQEFENAETADARFAKALDRFQPLLVNVFTEGGTWAESGISYDQVVQRYGPAIRNGTPGLWTVCEQWIAQHFATQRHLAAQQSVAADRREDAPPAER
jgi:putative hydrolase of HD superfamily